jgi:hypothetical protein
LAIQAFRGIEKAAGARVVKVLLADQPGSWRFRSEKGLWSAGW